jgi:hypothetical protein
MMFALILLFQDFRLDKTYMAACIFSLIAGGWLSYRSPRPWRRILALASGLTLAMGIAAFNHWLTGTGSPGGSWILEFSGEGKNWLNFTFILGELFLMLFVIFLPGVLKQIHWRDRLGV